MFNANNSSWMSTTDQFADNFQAQLCNGDQLLCARSNESKCVTIADVYEAFRTRGWEWNYW